MRKLFIIPLVLLIPNLSFSQETKKDTLKTEEIIVVKPFTPKISKAFKVRSNPEVTTINSFQKEKIIYSIFSIPVASTFTPAKGKAKGIKKEPRERLYKNYISAGFGNFKSPFLEAYFHFGENRYSNFGIFINHYSSQGGINNFVLDNSFSNTRIDGYYKQFDRDYNWQINTGVQRQHYNYYGIPSSIIFNDLVIDSIDEKQVYKNIYIGGEITFEDSFFNGATVRISNFSDNFNSNEIRLVIKPKLEFPIASELLNATFSVDLLSGKFNQNYAATNTIKHSFLNVGFNPNLEILKENLTINLGAKLYYSNNLENKTTVFYAYPNITTSFKIIDDIFILVAGVTGDLQQNTYQNFVKENPFVSPTLTILQTDKQYKSFVGAKGKLASNIGYNFTVAHTNEKNKPLFIQNQTKTDGTLTVANAYEAGNSFNVIYDHIKTLNFYGEITIDASKEFNFESTFEYANFTTNTQQEAWNLPTIKATISANYQNKNWFAGSKLFYSGSTKDFIISYGMPPENGLIIENESYIDLNFNGGYIFSDRLTAFAKINNALGKKYHPFVNYQVQTLQILAGISYKFDL